MFYTWFPVTGQKSKCFKDSSPAQNGFLALKTPEQHPKVCRKHSGIEHFYSDWVFDHQQVWQAGTDKHRNNITEGFHKKKKKAFIVLGRNKQKYVCGEGNKHLKV